MEERPLMILDQGWHRPRLHFLTSTARASSQDHLSHLFAFFNIPIASVIGASIVISTEERRVVCIPLRRSHRADAKRDLPQSVPSA